MEFDDAQIGQISARLGMPPEQVVSQLQAEGHGYTPQGTSMGVGGPLSVPLDQTAFGAPPQLPAYQAPMGQAAALEAGAAATSTPALVQPEPQAMMRARGPSRLTPQQAPQGEGGMGRVRKMFDARQRALDSEYTQAAQAYGDSAEKLKGLQNDAFDFEQQKLNAEAGFAEQRAQQLDGLAKEQERWAGAEQQARAREDEAVKARTAKVEQRRQDWANAQIKKPSMGAQAASAIAVALSGIGDALMVGAGRQGNSQAQTMQLVQAAVDRDVNAQLERLDRTRQALTDEDRAIQDMRASFGNDRAFRQYLRGAMQEQYATRIDALAAKSGSETAKITADAASTMFRTQAQADLTAALAAGENEARQRLRDAAEQRFGLEVSAAMPKGGAAAKKATPGVVGLVPLVEDVPAADRGKAQEIATGTAGIRSTIEQLEAMAKKGATLSPTERGIARRRITSLKSQFNGVFGDGTAPNEAQLEELDGLFANPTEIGISDKVRQFEVLRQDAERLTNDKLRQYSFALDSGGSNAFREE